MVKNFEKNIEFPTAENCPMRNIVARFGNKWAMLILYIMYEEGTIRFRDIIVRLPEISTKVLSKELKVLEEDGLIIRKAYAIVPPKVEYTLSARGASLIPIIVELYEWAKSNMQSIKADRVKYQSRNSTESC
ncbi:MAG: helix-turn-helix transcriptional regulator [Bacteroides sp.]|nr:helix-turn-helix transcriptional regulator [Bacteroides sp.]